MRQAADEDDESVETDFIIPDEYDEEDDDDDMDVSDFDDEDDEEE